MKTIMDLQQDLESAKSLEKKADKYQSKAKKLKEGIVDWFRQPYQPLIDFENFKVGINVWDANKEFSFLSRQVVNYSKPIKLPSDRHGQVYLTEDYGIKRPRSWNYIHVLNDFKRPFSIAGYAINYGTTTIVDLDACRDNPRINQEKFEYMMEVLRGWEQLCQRYLEIHEFYERKKLDKFASIAARLYAHSDNEDFQTLIKQEPKVSKLTLDFYSKIDSFNDMCKAWMDELIEYNKPFKTMLKLKDG